MGDRAGLAVWHAMPVSVRKLQYAVNTPGSSAMWVLGFLRETACLIWDTASYCRVLRQWKTVCLVVLGCARLVAWRVPFFLG